MKKKDTEDVEMSKESEGHTVRVKECGVEPEESEENSPALNQLIMDKIITHNGFFHTLQVIKTYTNFHVMAQISFLSNDI